MPPGQEPTQPIPPALPFSLRLWILIVLTGVGAGLAGGLLMRLLHAVQHLCYDYTQGHFIDGVEHVSGMHRVAILVAAGVLAGAVLAAALYVFGESSPNLPEAVRKHHGELPQRATATSAILSIIVVGMGTAIGREASLKEAGGLVGTKLADVARLTPAQRQLLVACGIGAGMAAAYNVPFGGALFTLEVLLETVSLTTVLPAFVTSFIATAVSWLLLPNEPTYKVPTLLLSKGLMIWALVAGPLLGLASVLFVRGIHWAKDHKPKDWKLAVLPVVILGALGLSSIHFPELLGNGKDVAQLAFDVNMGVDLLFWLVVLRPLATIAVLRAGVPGGLFTPTCAFGSLAGLLLGQAWSYVSPATDKRCCAVVGMAAVLAASTEAPVSSLVFVLELTWHAAGLIVPLLIAMCGAILTYRRFETRSTY